MNRPMKRRIYNASPAPLWRDSVNYPAAPPEPAAVAKSTVKSQVDYPTFVNGYARRVAWYTFSSFAGVAAVVGSIIRVDAEWGILLIIVGFGMIAAGGAGVLATWSSHEQWQNNGYGVSTTETYAPRKVAPPETVRPFVSSNNGTGKTTNTGRLKFAPTVWQSLIDMALANGGTLTRDIAMKANVGREWYNTDPNAPIFDFAHYGIVGNAMLVLHALSKAFAEHLSKRSALVT